MFLNYLYATGVSETFRRHFASMADLLVSELNLNQDSLVVDIGSNDGLLLGSFKKLGCKVVGVEPASNLASIAEKSGIPTINDFFRDRAVDSITVKYGRADLITATNVFAHVDNVSGFLSTAKNLLKNDGRLVIEVPYLARMIEMMTFDTIYHEHLSYFSALSMVNLIARNRMQVTKIDEVDIHGGSLRVLVKNRDAEPSLAVQRMLKREMAQNLNKIQTYTRFAERVTKSKSDLLRFLASIRARNQTIVGYGAAAKANTLLNYCGIGKDYIEYIVDDSPLKQGLLTPGTHIPVLPSKTLSEERPNYILILAWNLADEIVMKVRQNYGEFEFIVPLPHPRFVR
jgi:2-polyprenyl-3-methyl-5-hydroxy-6-metoxy-1,4-benzoquinol methylase